MSALTPIRKAIVASIKSVPKIGVVHEYERYAGNTEAFKKLYVTRIDGKEIIAGWHVRRWATRSSSDAIGLYRKTIEWRIRGFRTVSDADQSELIFDDQIEALCDVFLDDETLGGTVQSTVVPDETDQPAGLQLLASSPVMFCGVLCHRAELALFTRLFN